MDTFEYTYFDNDDTQRTALIDYEYRPGRAAITRGASDNWAPSDPDEFDIIAVHIDGKKLDIKAEMDFLHEHQDKIEDQFFDSIGD